MNTHPSDTVGYINAGGRGTRLNGLFTPDEETGVAKALLAIGKPETRLVDHHIANLRQQGIGKVVVAAGDQRQVFEYVNDVYEDEPDVQVTRSAKQLGTGGDLVEYARLNEIDENIVVQNVDTILDIDLNSFLHTYHHSKKVGGVAAIALTLSSGVPNEGAYKVAKGGTVRSSREFCEESKVSPTSLNTYYGSSTGAVAIRADFLRQNLWLPKDGELSLYRQVLKDAWERKGLFAYNNKTKFFRDIGTAATWLTSQGDVELQRNLRYNDSV